MMKLLLIIILGPLGPWVQRLEGKRRRDTGLTVAFVIAYALLWILPLQWEWIAVLYLFLGTISFSISEVDAGFSSRGKESPSPWMETLALSALVVYPILFAYALMIDIDHLRTFSIHLPASVYIEALTFALCFGIPGSIVLAILIRHARLKAGVRLVLYLYGGAWVTLIWIGIWEKLHRVLYHISDILPSEPLFFDVYHEATFRFTLRAIFYGVGIFLGAGYLASSLKGRIFFRRALFLVFPTALAFANLTLLIGEGGHLLAATRGYLYRAEQYPAYRVVAEIEIARMPKALHVPFIMNDLADLASLQGGEEEASHWRKKILKATEGKPFDGFLHDQVAWEDSQLAAHPHCVTADSMQLLSIPRARPGATLDANWYGLLSAVSYFRPTWSDFDLKKRLLEVSPDIQLSAPNLSGVPALAEVLDVFGIPFSTCFLDSTGIHRALNAHKIPFINVEDRWVPIVGWDPCRRGYLFYRYSDAGERNPWLHPVDKEMVLAGKEMGGNDSSAKSKDVPYNLIGFLPEHDLLTHLHDLGGVALVLGDSTFAPANERRAAYLAEYGDVLYQNYDDNQDAAQAYARAQSLYPSDYILARAAYLEHHASWSEGPDYGTDAIFREGIRDQPLPTGLNPDQRQRMVQRIVNGEMGQYLLLNWHESSLRFFAGKDSGMDEGVDSSLRASGEDSSQQLFRTWLRLEPHNPAAIDSLASGFAEQGQWDSVEVYVRRLIGYYPMGNEDLAYELAWALFKQDRFDELDLWLKRCESQEDDARYLTMLGALDWQKGHHRSALENLRKSLKLDKTLPETFSWMERIALAEHDSAAASLAHHWRERTAP